MQSRRLLVTLRPDIYDRLERVAQADDRTPAQQAAALIRAALTEGDSSRAQQGAARYEAIYTIVEERQPTGIRFAYYTAPTRGIVPKTDSGYVKVQRAILKMRRDDTIPWPWIVDTNRWMRKPQTWNSIEEALTETANLYRRAWRGLLILYVGDHDPAGYEIETNLRAKLIQHSGRDDIDWLRLACDAEQVKHLARRGTTPKKNAWRDAMTGTHVAWHGPAVEVEAIDPPLLRWWLDAALEVHADRHALAAAKVAEEGHPAPARPADDGGVEMTAASATPGQEVREAMQIARALIEAGVPVFVQLPGGERRIPESELTRLLRRRRGGRE